MALHILCVVGYNEVYIIFAEIFLFFGGGECVMSMRGSVHELANLRYLYKAIRRHAQMSVGIILRALRLRVPGIRSRLSVGEE